MSNDWKQIWEKRSFDYSVLEKNDLYETFMALKRSDGFDVMDGGLTVQALYEQYQQIMNMLSAKHKIQSVYEVGCGGGGNLLLMEHDGITCGGIDYSNSLITIAKHVLKSQELLCDEALYMPVEPVYDAVFSNSVISYFPDMEYAAEVLEKMCAKARYAIGLIDVHDLKKQQDYIDYRTANITDYEERYKNLPKLFYPRSFFELFAERKNLELVITKSEVTNYWNNDFVFNCYFYKKELEEK